MIRVLIDSMCRVSAGRQVVRGAVMDEVRRSGPWEAGHQVGRRLYAGGSRLGLKSSSRPGLKRKGVIYSF